MGPRAAPVSTLIDRFTRAGRAESERGCESAWSHDVILKDKDLIRCEQSRNCCEMREAVVSFRATSKRDAPERSR